MILSPSVPFFVLIPVAIDLIPVESILIPVGIDLIPVKSILIPVAIDLIPVKSILIPVELPLMPVTTWMTWNFTDIRVFGVELNGCSH